MKLFLLIYDDYSWDEYDRKLIRAKNEDHAREIANTNTGDEGRIWTDKKLVQCEIVTVSGESCEVIGSFNAG